MTSKIFALVHGSMKTLSSYINRQAIGVNVREDAVDVIII